MLYKNAYSDQQVLYGCTLRQPHCRGLTSLPQNKSWHHRWADTAPLSRLGRHCAGLSLPPMRSCDICALGYCWFAYRAREDPPPPPCAVQEDPASLPSPPLPLLCGCWCWGTNNPPSPSTLHPSRPLLLTHQRQCTVYSLPAATMETGVVVYDSERPVCREIDWKRQGKRDKE